MNVTAVMAELKSMGSDKTKATMQRHGAPENFFGVKVGDMKKIVKKVKVDQKLAEDLFATGNGDAQYLAGLIADPQSVKPAVLKLWAKTSVWGMVSEYSVAGVSADSPHGWKLGLEWIDAKSKDLNAIGWNTLSGVLATRPDDELDTKKIKTLLTRVKSEIHKVEGRTAYTMNGFVIAVGSYVESLTEKASEIAEKIGKVEVDMGDTACKVPHAPDYIAKVVKAGRLGKKRKKAYC
jgi:hypothetical protein